MRAHGPLQPIVRDDRDAIAPANAEAGEAPASRRQPAAPRSTENLERRALTPCSTTRHADAFRGYAATRVRADPWKRAQTRLAPAADAKPPEHAGRSSTRPSPSALLRNP